MLNQYHLYPGQCILVGQTPVWCPIGESVPLTNTIYGVPRLSIHPTIHPSIHQSVHPFINQSINQLINQANQLIIHPINQSISQCLDQCNPSKIVIRATATLDQYLSTHRISSYFRQEVRSRKIPGKIPERSRKIRKGILQPGQGTGRPENIFELSMTANRRQSWRRGSNVRTLTSKTVCFKSGKSKKVFVCGVPWSLSLHGGACLAMLVKVCLVTVGA